MFEYERTEDRTTLRRPDTRWLSNGFDGGYVTAETAHNLTVPKGFERTDLAAYVVERLGTEPTGPTLLTGVSQGDACGARWGPIEAVVTAGLSNPAVLPVADEETDERHQMGVEEAEPRPPGTVNVFVGSTEPLTDGGLAGLLATAVETKTAVLMTLAGCTGTTSDAVVVGCPDVAEGKPFAGSATEIGNAARVCVRDGLVAALSVRYDGEDIPDPNETGYGIVTSGGATVFRP